MEIEKVIPLILIIGTISLYFMITGIKGLLLRRMKVLNPLADTQSYNLQDLVFNTFKKQIESDINIPEGFVDKNEQIVITGNDLLFRAWFHIGVCQAKCRIFV